jgi:hypothetical protein
MGRDYHSPPRHSDGTLLLAGTPQTKLRTLLAVLSLGGLLRLPCLPRGLTPSGLCCPHDVPPAPLSPGCRRTRWSRIFDGQVTMPYRERGACISQGGYILLPRSLRSLLFLGCLGCLVSQLEQKVPPTQGTRRPPHVPQAPAGKNQNLFMVTDFVKLNLHISFIFQKNLLGGTWGFKNRPLVFRGYRGTLFLANGTPVKNKKNSAWGVQAEKIKHGGGYF